MSLLHWCPRCNEKSVRTKLYSRDQVWLSRFEYCINKGCGYRLDLPRVRMNEHGQYIMEVK